MPVKVLNFPPDFHWVHVQVIRQQPPVLQDRQSAYIGARARRVLQVGVDRPRSPLDLSRGLDVVPAKLSASLLEDVEPVREAPGRETLSVRGEGDLVPVENSVRLQKAVHVLAGLRVQRDYRQRSPLHPHVPHAAAQEISREQSVGVFRLLN